jgi:NAD(P)-dependent dehydrogenase (short-subunit alcohol dehydrogenase family)
VVADVGHDPDGVPLADSVIAEIVAAGGDAVACVASVAVPATQPGSVATARSSFATVDVVVNNAGIARPAPAPPLP